MARKPDLFSVLYGPEQHAPAVHVVPTIDVSALPSGPAIRDRSWTGDKFHGGFGPTDILFTDYWTLRLRSAQLFKTNLYGRGLIRRLVTNVINTGLHLEATPAEKILGREEDSLADWSEDVETRFELWGKSPRLCDHFERHTFGQIQATAWREALVEGDCLIVLRQDKRTQLPRVQLISASRIQTPLAHVNGKGPEIVHGVELDAERRHVAFHVRQNDGSSKRLAAYGPSGRRVAWLVYGTDKRLDDVRGEPLLSLVLQSINEIDKYRDSTQRKALINSMLAMYVKKTEDKPGTRSLTGGAIRRGVETTTDSTGQARSFRTAEMIPGLVIDELQMGEEPQGFPSTGTDEKFGEFEKAILASVAWANGCPPEILTLAFSNNYSASQAAINEFKLYLNDERTGLGSNLCQPIYEDWILSQALTGRVQADGMLKAWRDPEQQDIYAAWVNADWSGHVKPSTDLLKQATGYELALKNGLMTYDRAAREFSGTKFEQNVKKIKREAEKLAEALKPLAELEAAKKPKVEAPPGAGKGSDNQDDQRDRKAS